MVVWCASGLVWFVVLLGMLDDLLVCFGLAFRLCLIDVFGF